MTDYDPFFADAAGGSLSARPLVIGQLGQSLDGRVATLSGESKYISGACALDHLHRLRAAADAVLVGIGTVLADDPLLNVRRVPGRNPARVIIDPNGRLGSARCLADDGARRLVVRRAGPGGTGQDARGEDREQGVEIVPVAPRADGSLAPQAILAALQARGLSRILMEGGPATLAAFIDADALDRLHVVVSPVILGSGRTGLDLHPISRLAQARRPTSRVTLFGDGDVLFECDLRAPPRAPEREKGHDTHRESALFQAG